MILNSIKNLNSRNKLIITFLFYLVLIIMVIYFIIIPRVVLIKRTSSSIIDRKVFLEEQYLKARSFIESNKDFKIIGLKIKKLDEVFVNYDKNLEFIEILEEVADENNIEQKISLGLIQKEDIGKYQKVTLEIIANGNFQDLVNYIIGLETLDYYVNVGFLSISAMDGHIFSSKSQGLDEVVVGDFYDKPGSSRVVCRITADTYWK